MDAEELRVAGLTIRIDRLLCVGFETCVEIAPHLFQIDDEGIAVFHPQAAGAEADLVVEACRSCPVDALEVFDGSGRQLAP